MNLKKLLRIKPIPRAAGVSRRAVVLGLGGRFTDELLSGALTVLMPTFRARFGLSYTQISVLWLALQYVSVAVEPVSALLIDVWRRRRLMAWGAAFTSLSVMVVGVAPTFLLLLAGFAIYGLGSGPLAHTADVVLVEAHPAAPDRIFTRAVAVDTIGAMLAPLLVTLTFWLGLPWRGLLAVLALAGFVYALLLWRTRFPAPADGGETEEAGVLRQLRANLRAVLGSPAARRWMLFLMVFDVVEAPIAFRTVWLNETAGMSQAVVGLYTGMEMAAGFVTLLALDHLLARGAQRWLLYLATVGLLIIYPLWLFWPGAAARFVLGVPLSILFTIYWPIARSQSLASVPGRAGALTALMAVWGVAPLSLLVGLLAEAVGLTTATLWVSVAGLLLMAALIGRLPLSRVE